MTDDDRERMAALREYHGRPDLDRMCATLQGAALALVAFATAATLIWFLWV